MATYNRFTIAKPDEQKAVTTANRFTVNQPVVNTVKAEPAKVQIPSAKPAAQTEPVKTPYSFMESIKPLNIKVPQTVSDFVAPLKTEYQTREGELQKLAEKQKTALQPIEDLVRKPLESTVGTAIKTGEFVADKGEETALKILNHPVVSKGMVELSKRTSGTGVVSAVQAIGPKTFNEAYEANRAYQAGDPSKLNQFLYQLGDTLPQTAVGVALNFAPLGTGPALSTAYWTALSASEQIQNKGSVTSLGNIGIDIIGDKMLGSSIEALFKTPAKTLIQTMVKNFSVEGGTEVAQDLLKMSNDYRNAKTPEERAQIMAQAKEYFTSGQILITGLVGGISGMAVGTAGYTINQTLPKEVVNEEGNVSPPKNAKEAFDDSLTTNKNLLKLAEQNGLNYSATDLAPLDTVVKKYGDIPSVSQFKTLMAEKYGYTDPNSIEKLQFEDYLDLMNIQQLEGSFSLMGGKRKLFPTGDEVYSRGMTLRQLYESDTRQPLTPSKTITNNETSPQGPGFKKMATGLDQMVKLGTIFPEDATILKTLFENTSDNFLDSLSYTQSGRMKSSLGSFTRKGNQVFSQRGGKIQLQKGIAIRDKAIASRVFLHEFGHAGYYQILSADERAVVNSIFRSMSKSETRLFFSEGTGDNPNYHAGSPEEFFAESFAEYILANKVSAKEMEPLLKRVARRFFEGLKRLVNRKEHAAVDRLRPVYEKILSGQKDSPLSEFAAQESPNFNAELRQLMNEAPTKAVPPASIFPSGAVQNQQIEPQAQEGLSPMEQIEISAAPSIQQLPFDFQPEPLQKVIEGDKRTPLKERIRWIDYLRTPWRVFERMGIKANYLELLEGYTQYVLELPKNIDKITAWSKQVGKESNERIFRFLDGEKIELNPQEAKVAGEIKTWLSQWADRLGMAPDARISSYITHIFPQGSKGEIPEEIAYLINKKIPGQVYDPYLLERAGAEGYIKDTWKALDAYVKRATRKVNMDPALASLKEASAQLTDTSQLNYLNRYIGAVNLRPTELDTSIDNHIKEKFGYMFGVRPTSSLTRQARQMIARAKIGWSVTSFAKNLTQGVNTFAELGTQYTARGYIDLVKFGGKELNENGVLIAPFLEDQTYSAIKKFAEKFDKILFLNMNASELVNRGAAYYGAKAKYLAGNITPKEISKALNKEVTKDYTPSMEDAIAYGKFVAAKTQFVFGPLDTPVALNSDIAKTFAQFQTFGLKQAEFIGSMANEREWAKLFRYILSSMLLFTYIGGAFGMKWDDSFKTLRFGMPPVIQFLIDIWGQGIVGEDKYGNKLTPGERVKAVGKSIFTNVVPAGAQIMRGAEGFQAVNAGKSTTKSGDFQYKIAQTPMNYIKGTLFGKYNLPEAKAFTKEKNAPKKSGTSRKRF